MDKLITSLGSRLAMNRLGELLGSATRGNLLEGLALSDTGMTAYGVAKAYNMNVAKVYLEMKRLERLGLVKSSAGIRGKEYALADESLKDLALKLSSRVQTYSSWKSPESRRDRFRMGLASIPPVSIERLETGSPIARKPLGELENLAILGRKRFGVKYVRTGERSYDRL